MNHGAIAQESGVDRGKGVVVDRGELCQMRFRDRFGGPGGIGKVADRYAIIRIYVGQFSRIAPIQEHQSRLSFGNRESIDLRFLDNARACSGRKGDPVKRRQVGKTPLFIARCRNGQLVGALDGAHAQCPQPGAAGVRNRVAAVQQVLQIIVAALYTHYAATLPLNSAATQS